MGLVLNDPDLVVGLKLTVLEPALVVGPAPLHLLQVLALHPHVAYATSDHLDQVDSLNMSGPTTGGCEALSAMLTWISVRGMRISMFLQLLFSPVKLGTRHTLKGAFVPFSVSLERTVVVGGEIAIPKATMQFLQSQRLAHSLVGWEGNIFDKPLTR